MKIEVVHYRDPEEGCDLSVFVDGVLAEVNVCNIDPGAGYDRNTWEEVRDAQIVSLSAGASVRALRFYEDADASPYIGE